MSQHNVMGEAWRRTVEEPAIVELLLAHGWPFELQAGARASALPEAQAALERLVALGLPHGRSETGQRLFDTVETVNFLRWAGRRHLEPTLLTHNMPTMRRLVMEAHPDGYDGAAGPRPPTELGPREYAVTIRRTFNLDHLRPGQRVRLRLPLPIEDASLSDLRIEPLPPDGVAPETVIGPARLDVQAAVPPERELTVGVRTTFTARPTAPAHQEGPIDPAEAELYTRPTEGLIKLSDRVRALAAAIADGETDSRAVVRRVWNFMLGEMAFGAAHYDRLDPADPLGSVLDAGWCDCRQGAALFAALCRARGIPARVVNGYMLQEASPGFHTWNEAWLDGLGWTPFDLYSRGLAADGDPAWREHFFGCVDHRMATDRPPRLFGGTGTVRLPAGWHLLATDSETGSEIEFRTLDSSQVIYREHIAVERH